MTEAQLRFWNLAHQRTARLQPDVSAALLRVFATIRDSLNEAELTRMIAVGSIEAVIAAALSVPFLERAVIPFRVQLRKVVERGFLYAVRDLPKAGKVDGTLAVSFDHLSPHVIEAVKQLDTRVVTSLKDEVRETVRAAIQKGLEDGKAPRSVARGIRDAIGLGKTQAQEVLNFRDALEGKNGRTLSDYALRNKRLDAMLKKGPLTAEQVERYTEVYRKARIANNANVVSRTATLDAYKLGQKLSWQDAEDKGVIPEGFQVMRQWIGMKDDRERPEHWLMNDEVVPADDNYSSGQSFAGEGDYGCRCLDRYFLARAA